MGRPLHLLPTHSLLYKSHHPPWSFPSLLASTSLRSPFPGPTIRSSVPARTTAIRSSMAATASEAPPRAKKVRHEMEMFGDVRVDEYYWIRDDSRKDPEVLAHLAAENSYTDEVMSGEKELQDQLYAEMRGRIKEADVSVPLRKGAYYYYEKNLEGKEYIQHCRRRVPDEGSPLSVHDVMPTHSDAPPEYVILDENVKAQGHTYYRVGGYEVSPDNKLVAYAEDTKGNEIYTVYIIDAETGVPVEKPLVGVTSYFEWAGNSTLIYITMDEILREDKEIQLFRDHLVVYQREGGLPTVVVHRLPAVGHPLGSLEGGRSIDFIDPVYSVEASESQFSSNVLRFTYTSLKTPETVYDYDMDTGVSVVKKTKTVLGDFDSSKYVTERKWASADDGTQIPLSIVYKKDLVKLDGSDPLLLYGYGSYEACIDPYFKDTRLSLLDPGFIYTIAHIRGGGEMGREWYENGKYQKKKNTFTDFISAAEYLIEKKYCTKEKLCIHGRSAGGLLIGAVINMRPELFKAAVAGVPFVDVLTTMLDPTIPLTTSEWEEWGDPHEEEFYHCMKSYSPVDNVKAQDYPHLLVQGGLNDPRVGYFEPAKFVAKLRELKTDDNLLLFKCDLGAGHFSKSGRFEKLQEEAFTYAFIIKALDLLPSRGPA
ncbi:hypothetical protein Droror1_Dr00019730 [Drosera rotundifolia]